MNQLRWDDLSPQVVSHMENEDWVNITNEKKSEMLGDLRHPENMVAIVRFVPGHDMINFKIYRPNGLTRMQKFAKWIFIPGIAEHLEQGQKTLE